MSTNQPPLAAAAHSPANPLFPSQNGPQQAKQEDVDSLVQDIAEELSNASNGANQKNVRNAEEKLTSLLA